MKMEEDSTWKEMERRVSKNGYRDGAAAGHKSTFQAGFDEGFKDGVRLGLALGQKNGSSIIHTSATNAMLPQSNCQICEDPNLLECDYEKIKETQAIANIAAEASINLSISN